MARVAINTGSIANDGTGDTLRAAGGIINSNFSDIYNYFGDGTNLNFSGGNWEVTAVGINTLSSVGIGTTNPRFALEVGAVGASGTSLWVNGNARVTGILTVGTASITLDGSSNTISVGSGVTINGSTGIIDATSIVVGGTTLTGAAVTRIEAGSGISVDQNTGQVTITATGGGGESYWSQNATGINTTSNIGIGTTTASSALTVQGNTSLETLNVSGVSTFSGAIDANSTANFQGDVTLQSNLILGDNDEIQLGAASGGDLLITHLSSTNNSLIRNKNTSGSFIIDTATGSPIEIRHSSGGEPMGIFTPNGSVDLYYDNSKKFETFGAGVTITGTTFTDQLSVSGVSTLGTVTGATYYGDASNAADGRWNLSASGTDHYIFSGIGITAGLQNDPTLHLQRGRVYEFVNEMGAHPFQIQLDYQNTSGQPYNVGVVNNGVSNGTLRWEVPFNAPNTLYYQCTSHVGMSGTIHIAPSGYDEPIGFRTTRTVTTSSLGAGSSESVSIQGFKTYGLLKVDIGNAAWVTLYTDSASRTADASARTHLQDPEPGSGVIAEVYTETTGSSSFKMAPGVIGWNNDSPTENTIYLRVLNNESTSTAIGVTITLVKMED